MDAGIAAVLGAAVGLVGAVTAAWFQARAQRQSRDDEIRQELQQARLLQYVELLTAAREVRYIALRTFQKLATRTVGEVDEVLTKMSKAYYLIAITSSQQTADLAWALRESAFDLWRRARDDPNSNRADWLADVRKVRADAEQFRLRVRQELAIAPVEPREPHEDDPQAVPTNSKAD
jgi:hypothetical protein